MNADEEKAERREPGRTHAWPVHYRMIRKRILIPLLGGLSWLGVLGAPGESAPKWFQDAVWYQIFPERFRNGDPRNDPVPSSMQGTWPYSVPPGWKVSPWTSDWYAPQSWETNAPGGFYRNAQLRRYGGDLQGILDRLDYLQDLGVTAIYLNPVFESPSLHKYGATLYHHIDRHFGPDPAGDLALFATEDPANPATWKWSAADRLFLKLVAEIHRRRMRVILDGVFNHTGIPFWALQQARRDGQTSPYASWFHILRWDDPKTPADEFDYQGWVGVKDLPELARDATNLHPGVRNHLHDIVRRWMDPNGDGNPADGIDGWRLDVAAEVPMGFWREFRGWVKGINPEAYITGEIWWEDYQTFKLRNARPWLDQAFDGVMNYRFGDAVYQFFNAPQPITSGSFARLLTGIHEDYGYAQSLNLQNLMGSHDTARIGSAVVNPSYRMDHGANLESNPRYDVRAPNASELERWRQMVAFQFLAPGAPGIYYGDEAGMWGADDPDCRKPMVWPDLRYESERAHPFGAARPVDPVRFDRGMFQFYRTLAHARRDQPVLRRGDFHVVLTDDSRRLFAFRRSLEGTEWIAVFNAGNEAVMLPASDVHANRGQGWRLGLSGNRRASTELRIPAHGFEVLRRSKPPSP
jgi:glycosidase